MDGNIEKAKTRAFTPKAIIAGLLGILLIAAGSQFGPTIAKQSILNHQLGIGIYFYFFLICLLWNPFCSRYVPRLALNVKELAVAFVMTLTAGGFAWYGWMKQFATQSAMTVHTLSSNRSWQEKHIGDYLNHDTLPEPGENIAQFQTGIGEWLPFGEVPWSAWEMPLIYWGTVILLVALMSLALLLIVHRQWIRNEKLTYPLATVAQSLFEKKDENSHFADIFRSKLFWMSFLFVLIIHLYNFAQASDPNTKFKPIQMTYMLSGLSETFPIIGQTGCAVIRANGGRGLRYSTPLVDNIGVFSTGKDYIGAYNEHILEDAWTMGGNITYYMPFGASSNTYLSFDYFRTQFAQQMVVDYECARTEIHFYALDGKRSYTDNYQVDFSVDPVERFNITATFRYTDARIELAGKGLVEKPMTSRFKGVLNLQYATNLNKWIFDFTASLNGSCRVYNFMENLNEDGTMTDKPKEGVARLYKNGRTPVYPLLYAQITRRFKGWDVYVGAENLTNYTQKYPIIGSDNPFQPSFDASCVWGPLMGIKAHVGFRFTLWKKG